MYESEIEQLYQQPEDPRIELTIEEAKEVLEYLRGYNFPMELRDAIKERIKQVEKSNETK